MKQVTRGQILAWYNGLSNSQLKALETKYIFDRNYTMYADIEALYHKEITAMEGTPKSEIQQLQEENKRLREALSIMTSLCRLKYGNLDKDVYAEIEKAEALLQQEHLKTTQQ